MSAGRGANTDTFTFNGVSVLYDKTAVSTCHRQMTRKSVMDRTPSFGGRSRAGGVLKPLLLRYYTIAYYGRLSVNFHSHFEMVLI